MESPFKASKKFEIIILGGGIAGLSACRHLLLKIPSLKGKIAIIEPRSELRNNAAEDFKVGESTVEISATFFQKELELNDYLIENHPPKFSLQFHWPKEMNKTESITDYYSVESTHCPNLQSFQLNRSKIERDLLRMVIRQGAVYFHGKVKDLDITPGDKKKTVTIQLLSQEDRFEDQVPLELMTIEGSYLIDASGRNFLIGSRTDNILKGPENLYGLNNGSTWIRVKNVDRSYFDTSNENRTTSWYYNTNHFFGNGYWIWVIPLERGSRDFSIGVSYHKDVIQPKQLNSYDKFMSFLEKNQRVLWKLIKSGEVVDFHRWPTISHTSKTFFSPDNWCVIGDAAAIFDPFYSTGMVMIAFEVELTTELIKHKLAGDRAGVALRVKLFDDFIRSITRYNNHLIKDHNKHLGNASIMSWRIYMETVRNFCTGLPLYIGKYHLCPMFLEYFNKNFDRMIQQRENLLTVLNHFNDNDINIGFKSYLLGGQLMGAGDFCPLTSWDVDGALKNAMYGGRRLNIAKYLSNTSYYNIFGLVNLYYNGFGLKGFLQPFFWQQFTSEFGLYAVSKLVSWGHSIWNWRTPKNQHFYNQAVDVSKNYVHTKGIINWEDN
eukprot:gene822-1028_t